MKTLRNDFRFKMPVVTSVTPSSAGDNGYTVVTVRGDSFDPGTSITVDGVPATHVRVLSSSLLTCRPVGSPGVRNLVAVQPDGARSVAAALTILASPLVTGITPNTGAGDGGTVVTNLAGTGFVSGCTVTIGGAPATSVVFVSPTQLTCVTPAGAIGAKDIVVTNPNGTTSGLSGAGLFTFTLPFDPTTLVLSSYQRDFTLTKSDLGVWDGTPSAGTSALYREIASSGNLMPLLGAAVNEVPGAQYLLTGAAVGTRATQTRVISTGAAVLAESLVANTAYTASFLIDLQMCRKNHPSFVYLESGVMQADAHWGWMFRSGAALANAETTITINASAGTITRTGSNSWITDGFLTGQTVYLARTKYNNGFVDSTLLTVSASVLTFNPGHGLVDEVISFGEDPAISAGPWEFVVFNYTGTFPFVAVATTPGLHWYYVRRTASGTIQIDIDGVPGMPTALADHTGASGIQMQTNSTYTGRQMSFILYERFTSLTAQSNTDRDNYKKYLNARYGRAY